MALPATLVWEIRPTNGTANAGGGFDPSVASPGTDFSQQNAVQQAYTDLTIDAVTNTNITSVARAFSSVDVGNGISITGGTGFTTGIYNIRSVTGVIATVDRAVGTTGSTGGTGDLGGARSGFSVGTTTLQASLVAGQKAWVKNEAWNEYVNLTVAGATGSPITIEGYNTARGDNPTGANRPLNNRAAAAGNALDLQGTHHILKHLRFSNAGTDGVKTTAGSVSLFVNCQSASNGGVGFNFTNNPQAWLVQAVTRL